MMLPYCTIELDLKDMGSTDDANCSEGVSRGIDKTFSGII